MKSIKKAVVYGFAVWVIPFAIAIMIFQIRVSDRALFESIMPVVVTLCTASFSILYLRILQGNLLTEGVMLGAVWFVINIGLDLLMFMPESPMRMTLVDYVKDIGLTYLIIPTITIGFGYLAEKSRR